MPICSRCGRNIGTGYKFCPYCGIQLDMATDVGIIEHELNEIRYKARSCELWALFFFSIFIVFGVIALLLNAFGRIVDPLYVDFSKKIFYSSWIFFVVGLILLIQSANYNRRRNKLLQELKSKF